MRAATQVDIANAIAALNQSFDAFVGDLAAVAQMYVVQVLAKLRNGKNSDVGNVSTLSQDEVAKPRCHVYDLLHSSIGEPVATCQIENPKMLIDTFFRQAQESTVINQLTVGKPQLAQAVSPRKKGRYGTIPNLMAMEKIDLQYVWAVFSKSKNGAITQLHAFVEFELGGAVSVKARHFIHGLR